MSIESAFTVHVAAMDTGTRCTKCNAKIRAGEEFAIEPWAHGFDHFHVECPATPPVTGQRFPQATNRRYR